MIKSYEHCALECADTWFAKEEAFVAGLASKDVSNRLAALCRAAGHFKIARNFPKEYDVDRGLERLEPVLQILDDPGVREVTAENLADTVRLVRRELAAVYDRDLLSAATKLLWLRHQNVSIIFDKQARVALGTPKGDYEGYLTRWRDRYQADLPEIKGASLSVCATNHTATNLTKVCDSDIRAIVGRAWFHMRVLDIRLWYEGNGAS